MRLAELIAHTSSWIGIPEAQVRTVARVLQPAGLISSAGRNPRGTEMTRDDKINLLLGVCGVEVANRAAEYVRIWRRTIRTGGEAYPHLDFAFLGARDVSDLIFNLITIDLNGGPLDQWLAQAAIPGAKAAKTHSITVDFYIDEFSMELVVSRNEFTVAQPGTKSGIKITSRPIVVKFLPPPPSAKVQMPISDKSFRAPSRLIRRLDAANIRGWGTCLLEQ